MAPGILVDNVLYHYLVALLNPFYRTLKVCFQGEINDKKNIYPNHDMRYSCTISKGKWTIVNNWVI